jgi:hypothetical protein
VIAVAVSGTVSADVGPATRPAYVARVIDSEACGGDTTSCPST